PKHFRRTVMRARGPLTALAVTFVAAGAAGLAGHVASGARVRPADPAAAAGAPRITRIDDHAVVFDTARGRVGVAISPDGRTLYVSNGRGGAITEVDAAGDPANGKAEVKLYAENGAASSAPDPERR